MPLKQPYRLSLSRVFIIAASSLHYSVNTLPLTLQKRLDDTFKAIPGLSFKLNANNRQKTVHYLLSKSPKCMIEKNFVNWHDVINNSLSKHRSNNDNPLTQENLIKVLKEYKNKISAIIYVHRQNTPNIYGRLVETGILTINVTKHHLKSKIKASNKELIRKLKLIHPPAFLEIKNLRLIRRYFPNLCELINKVKSRRPSSRKRKADKQNISQMTTVEEYLTFVRHYKS